MEILEKSKIRSKYNKSNLGTLLYLTQLEYPQINSYDEWSMVLKKEFNITVHPDEIVEFFGFERDMEDNTLTLNHCGRWS